MNRVGVRELRQSLSRYLSDVKQGESFVVTERGREIARLSPSGPADSPIVRLAAERGATVPRGDLVARVRESNVPPAGGAPSSEILEELREERL